MLKVVTTKIIIRNGVWSISYINTTVMLSPADFSPNIPTDVKELVNG